MAWEDDKFKASHQPRLVLRDRHVADAPAATSLRDRPYLPVMTTVPVGRGSGLALAPHGHGAVLAEINALREDSFRAAKDIAKRMAARVVKKAAKTAAKAVARGMFMGAVALLMNPYFWAFVGIVVVIMITLTLIIGILTPLLCLFRVLSCGNEAADTLFFGGGTGGAGAGPAEFTY